MARVASFPREEFIRSRFRYRPGEHVTFLGPTGAGKTTLAMQLLDAVARPELPAVNLVMKPRDETARKFTKTAGFKTVRGWPAVKVPFVQKPRGYTVWPKHAFDPDIDDPRHSELFRRVILDSYKRGDRILFGDELYSLANELGLARPLVTVWTKGRSMDCGLWGASQRPTHIPLWAYSQAHHLFLHHDPDERARDRYKEIGGVNPDLVKEILARLPKFHWLYLRRDDGAGARLCVVEP